MDNPHVRPTEYPISKLDLYIVMHELCILHCQFIAHRNRKLNYLPALMPACAEHTVQSITLRLEGDKLAILDSTQACMCKPHSSDQNKIKD